MQLVFVFLLDLAILVGFFMFVLRVERVIKVNCDLVVVLLSRGVLGVLPGLYQNLAQLLLSIRCQHLRLTARVWEAVERWVAQVLLWAACQSGIWYGNRILLRLIFEIQLAHIGPRLRVVVEMRNSVRGVSSRQLVFFPFPRSPSPLTRSVFPPRKANCSFLYVKVSYQSYED